MKHTENEILEALKSNVKSEDLTATLPGMSEGQLDEFFNKVSYLLSNNVTDSYSQKRTKKESG